MRDRQTDDMLTYRHLNKPSSKYKKIRIGIIAEGRISKNRKTTKLKYSNRVILTRRSNMNYCCPIKIGFD